MMRRNLIAIALPLALLACADTEEERTAPAESPDLPEAAAPAPQPTSAAGAMLDPNTATADELSAIPGMNPSLTDAVIKGRPHEDMRSVDRALVALTDSQRDTVYTRLWKPLDLNRATKEEIELIPGVGPRMRHEFEEYRPYTSIEQFRREIGKYVDEAEVARLERYVAIRSTQ
jgi:DNA uptake protein ComE-like DNA-binding protein